MDEQKKKKTKNDGVVRETGYVPRDILKKYGLARKEQEKKDGRR